MLRLAAQRCVRRTAPARICRMQSAAHKAADSSILNKLGVELVPETKPLEQVQQGRLQTGKKIAKNDHAQDVPACRPEQNGIRCAAVRAGIRSWRAHHVTDHARLLPRSIRPLGGWMAACTVGPGWMQLWALICARRIRIFLEFCSAQV